MNNKSYDIEDIIYAIQEHNKKRQVADPWVYTEITNALKNIIDGSIYNISFGIEIRVEK